VIVDAGLISKHMKEHDVTVAKVDNRFSMLESNTIPSSEAYFKDFVFNMKLMVLEINILIGFVENDEIDNDNRMTQHIEQSNVRVRNIDNKIAL
jgi:hypothetical protein